MSSFKIFLMYIQFFVSFLPTVSFSSRPAGNEKKYSNSRWSLLSPPEKSFSELGTSHGER